MTHLKAAVICIGLMLSVLYVPVIAAQESKPAPAAPVPAQILGAKTVFVSNAGGENRGSEDGGYTGAPDRGYNQFYAAMKSWGRFDLVDFPAKADLFLEISFAEPGLSRGPEFFSTPYDSQFRLLIRDPKTQAVLWGFTEHADWAILQGNRDKNFDAALARVVVDLRALVSPSEAAVGSKKKK